MSCNFKIKSTHANVIPLNKEMRTIYKLFSSVPCDITVQLAPSCSTVGPRGTRILRGDFNPESKINYEEKLWDNKEIQIEIKFEDGCSVFFIEKLEDKINSMNFNSLNLQFQEDTNPMSQIDEVKYGVYPNELALKLFRKVGQISLYNFC
jgi:hypothetical protein